MREFGTFSKQIAERFGDPNVQGIEGTRTAFANLTNFIGSVENVDQKMYAGDGVSLGEYVWNDLKNAGKPEVFGKLVGGMLDQLHAADQNQFYDAMRPKVAEALGEMGFHDLFDAQVKLLNDIYNEPNDQRRGQLFQQLYETTTGGQMFVKDMYAQYFQNKERNDWKAQQVQKAEGERAKAFQNEVATAAYKSDTTTLGNSLKTFLSMPFFKGMGRDNLMPLGNQIRQNLQNSLQQDKTYQSQMRLLWNKGDKAALLNYHNTRVQTIAPQVVRSTVENMYPQYARGGAAAGRIAATQQKREAEAQAVKQSELTGQPLKVSGKPKDLIRENSPQAQIVMKLAKIAPKDFVLHEISGRGWVMRNGKPLFITWR
jgi:hypothetical protein